MRKRKKEEAPPLSEYWKPPGGTASEGGVGEAAACLATTFEFEADFFEAELLPRFLGLRFDHTEHERPFIIEREEALAKTRVAVLVEDSKFDPGQTTLRWDQVRIQVPGAIQHAKLTLLVWQRRARLIVASANLTRPGYRRNRELFAAIDFFDSADSAPLRLLRDSLNFIETLCTWSRALPAATARVRETVKQVRDWAQRWSNAPRDFGPRERPRAELVVGHPASENFGARSVMDQLIRMWQRRRVKRLTVMTPFVHQQAEGKDKQAKSEDKVVSRLRELQFARDAEGWLVVPEKPGPKESPRRLVPMPENFGKSWKGLFRQEDAAQVLLVPLCVEQVDARPRELHAKAVLIEGDRHDMLMIGSSNFTPHGMGVGAFNCEANLVFEDWADEKRDGKIFDERLGLPVSWDEAVGVDDVVWEASEESPEDAPPTQPHLPAFFAWASYSQETGEIRVGLDRSEDEPSEWAIHLPAQASEQALFCRRSTSAQETTLCYVLDEEARSIQFSALKVVWSDQAGTQHEAWLAMSVADRHTDLLPPAELRHLTLEEIIQCLLSGRDPVEWIARQERNRKHSPSPDAAIESLQAVDTSNYLLYRARRFGQALAAMADRIVHTAPTPEAVGYRLLRDPLGPLHLAEVLCQDGRSGENGPSQSAEEGYRVYAVAEIMLALRHVGKKIRRNSGGNWKYIQPLFQQAVEKLRALIGEIRGRTSSLPDDLNRYVEAICAECAQLLNTAKEK